MSQTGDFHLSTIVDVSQNTDMLVLGVTQALPSYDYLLEGGVSTTVLQNYLRYSDDGSGNNEFAVGGSTARDAFDSAIVAVLEGALAHTSNYDASEEHDYASDLSNVDTLNFSKHVVAYLVRAILGDAGLKSSIDNENEIEDVVDSKIDGAVDDIIDNIGSDQTGDGRDLLEQMLQHDRDETEEANKRFNQTNWENQADAPLPFIVGDTFSSAIRVSSDGAGNDMGAAAATNRGTDQTAGDVGVSGTDFQASAPARTWLIKLTLA